MEYSRIVAVTGLPGLFEILSSKTDGAIVRSLDDGSTKFVSSRVHNLSHLESIEIYTTGDNVSLSDIFSTMKGNSEALPNTKDGKALKGYFEKVYPALDFDRVYTSDMKKIVSWFSALQKHDIDFTLPPAEEGDDDTAEKGDEKNAAETLAAAGEKVTLEVTPDTVPEAAKTKTTRSRKKNTEE